MRRAIDETDRRRAKQIDFNQQHGITPKGIRKSVEDILEGARAPGGKKGQQRKVAEPLPKYAVAPEAMEPKQAAALLRELEQKMFQHAKNLEFEQAARLRDEIQRLKNDVFIH
jgi:excinuclease ABC subunit B